MSTAREAKLILRLVDGVSAPARAVVGALGRVSGGLNGIGRASMVVPNALGRSGRAMRRASTDAAMLSAPILAGAGAAAKSVYEYEKMGNAAEAVGTLTTKQREDLEAYGKELNKDFPFVNKDILEASFELLRSGQKFDQMMGSLRSTLNTSLAGDIGLGKTADIMTNIAQAMRLPMETSEQAAKTMEEISDVLAYSANESNTNIEEMAVNFRYVAPLAAATGMSLKEMAVSSMMLANNGIKGSNAGTGLRFALTRLLKPTKQAYAAMSHLGIKVDDFVKSARKVSAKELINTLSLDGINVEHLEKDFDRVLNDPKFAKSPQKLIAQLSDLVSSEMGEGIVDRKVLSDSLSQSLLALGTQVDLKGFLNAVRDHPDAEALFPVIFGVRHSPKMMALLAGDIDATLDELEKKYSGAADRMSRTRMKGVVGDVAKLNAAFDNLIITISKAGVLKRAVEVIKAGTGALGKLQEASPTVLEFGTYAALAAAAIAPLGFVIAGLTSVLGLLINPLAWAVGGLIALTGYLAVKKWDEITAGFEGFWASLKHHMGPETRAIIESITGTLSDFWAVLSADSVAGGEWAWRKLGVWFGKETAAALETFASAARWVADGIKYLASSLEGILGLDEGKIGSVFKTLGAWGALLAVGSIGFMLIVRPLKALGNALLVLSMIKPAWSLLKFFGRLTKLGAKASGISALAKSTAQLAKASKGLPGTTTGTVAAPKAAAAAGKTAGVPKGLGKSLGKGAIAGLIYYLGTEAMTAGFEKFDQWLGVDPELRKKSIQHHSLSAQLGRLYDDVTTNWNPGKYFGSGDTSKSIDGVFGELNRRTAPSAGGANTASPFPVDPSAAKGETKKLADDLEALLSIHAKPTLDESGLNSSLGKARELRDILGSLGGYAPSPMSALKSSGPGGGAVAPSTSSSHQTANTNHFHIQSNDPDAAARQVASVMDKHFGRSSQTAFDGRSDLGVA
ncbi:family phage tail tape measure protein [Roseibium sp. TrichSKD4]|uniref:phage tail tape measure protein n=1 Tax=Roseibium sp. TrichSKD4 TaxID=744980 RepID=UPI0001E56D5B|nr:phage tail tape measure protein [Roseibium sp. TrichSKD4]EFO32140.1 family phage tail tape measure protein [Roseibium sp. TrichSKD4]